MVIFRETVVTANVSRRVDIKVHQRGMLQENSNMALTTLSPAQMLIFVQLLPMTCFRACQISFLLTALLVGLVLHLLVSPTKLVATYLQTCKRASSETDSDM